MPDTATAPARQSSIRQFGKHQIASVVATVIDYLTMIVLVSAFGMAPVPGTVLGATMGGVSNFTLGRSWTFQVAHHEPIGQALRYAIVCGASLALNGLGEYVFATLVGLQYIVARVITSTIVSVAWNFPLQRYYVFRHRGEP